MESKNVSCAASYFLPQFNGISMGKNKPIAKPSIARSPRSPGSVIIRKCTNRSGHGTRCTREALPNRKRCKDCTRMNLESLRRNWPTRMVLHSRRNDEKRGFEWQPGSYITKGWLRRLFKKNGPTCFWCGATNLNLVRRTAADGFTIERLCNALPHLKRNCVFACATCNRKSWHANYKMPPFHLVKYRYSLDTRLSRDTILCQERLCLEIMANSQPKPYQELCARH